MQGGEECTKMSISHFDIEQKIFYLKPPFETEELLAVQCNIRLQGTVKETIRTVDITLPSKNYEIYRFVNPYLNAENDLFKLNYSDKTIGMIIPSAAIEDNDENPEEEFNEYLQAYKFYCAKLILEGLLLPKNKVGKEEQLTNLLHNDSIYLIICKPLIRDENFKFENCLPSLGIRGYYLFPENVYPHVLFLTSHLNDHRELNSLISNRYLNLRTDASLHIYKANVDIESVQLLKLLYKKILVQNNNPLFRFLVLYQVIEFLLEKEIRCGINLLYNEKDQYSNYDFFREINNINDTRKIINKLFNEVNFEDKAEITHSLKDFIVQNEPAYKKAATGDCLYDIRNLLFHDYKKVMAADDDGLVVNLVIQCEILIHHLINNITLN